MLSQKPIVLIVCCMCREVHFWPIGEMSSASNYETVALKVTLGEVVVQLSRAADKIDTPYLMFRINRLCVEAAVTVYGLKVYGSLGGINLADKIHQGE